MKTPSCPIEKTGGSSLLSEKFRWDTTTGPGQNIVVVFSRVFPGPIKIAFEKKEGVGHPQSFLDRAVGK